MLCQVWIFNEGVDHNTCLWMKISNDSAGLLFILLPPKHTTSTMEIIISVKLHCKP